MSWASGTEKAVIKLIQMGADLCAKDTSGCSPASYILQFEAKDPQLANNKEFSFGKQLQDFARAALDREAIQQGLDHSVSRRVPQRQRSM